MSTYRVEIPGEPQPKQRPRVLTSISPTGQKITRTITPKETAAAEDAIRWTVRAEYPGLEPIAGDDIHVGLTFFLGPRRSKRDRQPDLDNLVKLALDAMIGLAFADDKQVTVLTATLQRDSDEPRTLITWRTVWATEREQTA